MKLNRDGDFVVTCELKLAKLPGHHRPGRWAQRHLLLVSCRVESFSSVVAEDAQGHSRAKGLPCICSVTK